MKLVFSPYLLFFLPIILLFAGCDQSEDIESSVITTTGNKISLIGTWETDCHHNNNSVWDSKDKIIQKKYYSQNDSVNLELIIFNFDSSDDSCTGSAYSTRYTYSLVISSVIETISSWGSSLAPLTQDQSGNRISYNAEFTPLIRTLTAINGSPTSLVETHDSGFIIDDTGVIPVMYKIQFLGQYYGITENPYFKQ